MGCALATMGGFDDTAAKTDLTIIEHHGLAQGDGALGPVEDHPDPVAGDLFDLAELVSLAVTDFAATAQVGDRGRLAFQPFQLSGFQGVAEEQRMIVALGDNQGVVLRFLADYVPRLVAGATPATDAKALTLSQSLIHQPLMPAYFNPFRGQHRTRLGRQVALQELPETPFADEADAGTVFSGVIGETRFGGDGTDLAFGQVADGKQGLGEGILAHGVEKVTLVLVRVCAAQQLELPHLASNLGIMPGGDGFSPQIQGIVEERLELDVFVAQDVWVGGAQGPVFSQEVGEYLIPVLGCKIDREQFDVQKIADFLRFFQVFQSGAVFGAIILVPVFHEQAGHLVTLFQQLQSGDRRVNATRHADNDFTHAG